MKKVKFITLGCSKNIVDSTIMQGLLSKCGYKNVELIKDADFIIINTCGFIETAKEESINMIWNVVSEITTGEQHVILAGCLAERYSEELLEEISDVDAILGTGAIKDVFNLCERISNGERKIIHKMDLQSPYVENINKAMPQVTEYVKISEGCNNNCTYCIIPKLRGRNNSRRMEDIINEVKYLARNGTKEVILIAQNTTDYGIDIYGKYMLSELLQSLDEIDGIKWVRLLYLYPDNIDEKLIQTIKNSDKILNYLDIPLQHISDIVLKKMNRKTNKENIENTILKLRNEINDIVLRTTFIVGFPGESASDFKELLEFQKEYKLDKIGAFTYSREEDTAAYSFPDQVAEDEKERRLDLLMTRQTTISNEKMSSYHGKKFEALVEEIIDERTCVGRTYMDAPEIDGVVYIDTEKAIKIGEFVNVEIYDSMEYDLFGRVVI